ncbi:MAG: peptidoglycan DD-metalloendopeptidase family protein, partial [Anaerolineales bacterium]|nr:peptidoglycan DD-metalloendopeptidase family protein [Anaerolineales bacterium]
MQTRRLHMLFCSSWLLLTLAACQAQIPLLAVAEQPTVVLPTLMPTAPPLSLSTTAAPTATEMVVLAQVDVSSEMELAEETAVPTATPSPNLPPTFTPAATARPTQPPVLTATLTLPPTATPLPVATAVINRTCPDPVPLKPEYVRYYLSPNLWPAPNAAMNDTHFWLSKPLPGGGRYLINQTFPYGWDGAGLLLLHNGVDSADPLGTPVLAAAAGTVVVAQDDYNEWYGWRCDWYGHLVVIEHDQRWFGQPVYTLYGHVLNINVEAGQHVETGEQVAEVGFGGAATAPHLHFEVRVGSNEFGS